MNKPYLKKLARLDSLTVWLVDGFWVRNNVYLDFTEGGHDQVYRFIPKGEVWIDDSTKAKERRYVILHELVERKLMKKGMGYSQAHRQANKVELYERRSLKMMKTRTGRALTFGWGIGCQ